MHKALEHLIGPKYIHFSCGEAVTNAAVNELREGEKKKKKGAGPNRDCQSDQRRVLLRSVFVYFG